MAGTGAIKAETSAPAFANRLLFPSGGRLIQLIVAGGAVLVLGWAAYYVIGVLRSSAFNNDRAFRVLNEMVVQLDNFQGTMVNLIRLLPEFEECKGQRDCKLQWDRYTNKLNVPDISLSVDPSGSKPGASAPSAVRGCTAHAGMAGAALPDGRYELWIRVSQPGRPFTIRSCAAHERAGQALELRGSLRSGLPRFVAQTFFDEALLTAQDGTVLAAIGSGDGADLTRVELPPGGGDAQTVVDAAELLRRAADADASGDNPARPDTKATGTPASRDPIRYATAFDKTIAGKKYRVFVLPFQPSASWYVERYDASGNARAAQPEGMLYVLGLKQARVSEQITYQLWPDGAFAIAVVSLLLLLLWPLLRLKFSNPLEPISRTTAFAAMVSFMLIPGVICITAVWAWSRVTLINWADDGARRYADDVESYLVTELQTTTSLLQRYRDHVYSKYEGTQCKSVKGVGHGLQLYEMPLDEMDLRIPTRTVAATMQEDECQIQYLRREPTSGGRPLWSPLRTILALNRDGYSYGPRLTAFGPTPQRLKLELHDREYFQALAAGETWLPEAPREARADSHSATPPRSSWTAVPDSGFVAQRLFNRGDGALVLQVVVADDRKPFHRAVLGDTRAYGLTASVAPLLLRFAVVDNATGVVLFHSNEDRSLVENFFVETEHSGELQGKIGRRTGPRSSAQPWLEDLFTTNYLSEAHRFYVRPVSDMPWSVIVFYSTKALGDVPYQAGLAALVTFVLLIGIILIVVVIGVRLSGGTAGSFRRRLWPRWERRAAYVVLAWTGAGLVLWVVASFIWIARRDWTLPALIFAFGLLALGIVLYRLRGGAGKTKESQPSSNSNKSRGRFAPGELAYVACLFELALLLSALPATWLALHFLDLSLQSFVYNGLGAAAGQVERRHALIAEDLRRWVPDEEAREQRYPNAWALADKLSVPGFKVTQRTAEGSGKTVSRWEVTSFREIPWWNVRGPPADDSILRLIWSATHNSTVSRTWVPPERSADRENIPDAEGTRPASSRAEARRLQMHAQTKWQREYDGHRVSLVAWYSERDREEYLQPKTSTSPSNAKEASVAAERDSIPTGLRNLVLLLLLGGSLLGAYVLTLSVARRLFGSRSVFLFGPQTDRSVPADASAHGPDAIWRELKQADQLYLHQLAHDQMVNPTNEEGIERLTAARLIKFDPWPKIADPKLQQYAGTQGWEEEFQKAQQEASHSVWNSIRTPLLVVVLIVVGILLYVSSTTMQIVTTVFAGLASLLTYVSQAQNFLRQSSKS